MTKKTTIIELRDFDEEILSYLLNFSFLDEIAYLFNSFFPIYSVNYTAQPLVEGFLYLNLCNSIKYLTLSYQSVFSTFAAEKIYNNMNIYLSNLNIPYSFVMQYFFFIFSNKYIIIPALVSFCSYMLSRTGAICNNIFNFIPNRGNNSYIDHQAMINFINYISKFIEILINFLLRFIIFFGSNPFLLFLVFFVLQIKRVSAVSLIYQPYIAITGWFIYIVLMTWNDYYIRESGCRRLTLFFERRLNRAFITAVIIRVSTWIPLIGVGVTFSTSWYEWLHLHISSQDFVNIYIPSCVGYSILSMQGWLYLGGNREFRPSIRQVFISLLRAINESIGFNSLSSFTFLIYPLWVSLFSNENRAHALAFIVGILAYTISGWWQIHIELLNHNSWVTYTYGITYLLSFTFLSHSSSGLYNLMANNLSDTGLIIFISISGIFSTIPFSFFRQSSLFEGLSTYIVRLAEAHPFLYRWLLSVRQGISFYGFAIVYFYILYRWFY